MKAATWSPRPVGILYLLLFILSVPWYLPAGYGERLVAGFPVWCLISIACYVAAALLTVVSIDDVWRAEEAGREPS